MRIELNEWTEQKLKNDIGTDSGYIKLFYDTQDCGCNGVLVIQLIDSPLPTDILVQEQPFKFVVDRQQHQQFDETMRIEADREFPSFKVSSDASLYSTNVRVKDLRSKANGLQV
ncbi:iron-sulfur cluster biosynthesis family protein [Paenibacillus pinistramenti]|uniref:iron-sulfur cluster biosynthesis family protein n=1 Tax=Paenibacillus pinistramenti TaxID=1768003 RepID=UPI001109C2CD|nr:iron-sulfur cluster biosynthesis family protein [Paenibacillus pinistramenti]